MAGQAMTLRCEPASAHMPRSTVATFARLLLDKLRLNGQAPDYYGHVLRQGLAGDAATLTQII